MCGRRKNRYYFATMLALYATSLNSIPVAGDETSLETVSQQQRVQAALSVPSLGSIPIPDNPAPAYFSEPLQFSGARAYAHVQAQVAIGPRPVGSEAGWETGELIMTGLGRLGWQVVEQEFVFRGVNGRNIIASAGDGPVVILGAHYDTRPVADRDPDPGKRELPISGANDGASGVAVLLEIARVLDVASTGRQVWLAFFDAEDRGGIEKWPYSVGAGIMASRLAIKPQAVVIVDMVGDAEQSIFFEKYSDRALSREIWDTAGNLGYGDTMIPEVRHRIGDDHLPFLRAGIRATDIIDFDYPYWHTTGDTLDKVSPGSLERVGRTLVSWLHGLGAGEPESFVGGGSHEAEGSGRHLTQNPDE